MFNPSQFASISLRVLRCLSQKSDCLLLALAQALTLAVVASSLFLLVLSSLYRFQGSLVAVALALTTWIIIDHIPRFVKHLFKLFFFYIYTTRFDMPLKNFFEKNPTF